MFMTYVRFVVLVSVILGAIPTGRSSETAKADPEQLHDKVDCNHNVSSDAYEMARSIVTVVSGIFALGDDRPHATARMKQMMQFMMNPYVLIPQLIMLGFAPIVLANLKMLVMKALMMNNMALSTALWMTIRSLVFGPSPGPQVKYVNYGYRDPHDHAAHPPRDRRRRNTSV